MNLNTIPLLARALRRLPVSGMSTKRALYTDSIYPYPFSYFNETVYPSQVHYRENWTIAPWTAQNDRICKWAMRFFWTMFFVQLFNDPGVIIGHHSFPDPSLWTDAELGIPPDDAGLYEDFIQKREKSSPEEA